MASKDLELKLRIKADGTGVVGEIKTITQETKALAPALDNAAASADNFSDSQKKAGQATNSSTKVKRSDSQATKQLGEQYAKTTKQVNANAKSAKELAFATRNLPAQFTDIFVGLSTGQQPLTVLLQQGGQLKDMFGGIGPAFRAIGGYALGLLNPFTIAAGAVGALTAAYISGNQEGQNYQRQLVLTGNYAALTGRELQQLSTQFSDLDVTQGKAARTLADVVGTGRFTEQQIQQIAAAALVMEKAVGKSAEESIAEFEELAKAPSKTILALNETQHFLTAATYEQIAALEAQGKHQDAATLAIDTYANVINQRAPQITAQQNMLQKMWGGIALNTSRAIDSVKSLGRTPVDLTELEAAQATITRLEQWFNSSQAQNIQQNFPSAPILRQNAEALAAARQTLALQTAQTEQQPVQNKLPPKAITAIKALNKLREKSLSQEQQRARAIAQYKANLEAIRSSNPNSALLDEKQIRQDIAYINEQFNKGETQKLSAGQRMLEQLNQQHATLNDQLGSNTQLSNGQRERARFEQRIADIKAKDVLTAEEQSLMVNREAIRAQVDKNIALEDELRAKRELNKLEAFSTNLANQRDSQRLRNDNDVAGYGRGREFRRSNNGEFAIQQRAESQQNQLNQSFNNGQISAETYAAQTEVLQEHLQLQLDEYNRYYDALEQRQWDWQAGASEAFYNWADNATNVSQQTEQMFTRMFANLEEAAFQFVTTGKLNFNDLLKTLAEDFIRMTIRMTMAMAAQWLMQKLFARQGAVSHVTSVSSQAGSQVAMAGLNAFTSTAAIPIIGPALAPGAAVAATAAATPFAIAAVNSASAGLAGMAHEGIGRIPHEGTWLLDQGERVYTNESANQLDQMYAVVMQIAAAMQSVQTVSQPAPNNAVSGIAAIRIVNETGTERLAIARTEQRQTDDGETLVVFLQAAEAMVVDQLTDGGPIAAAGQRHQSWRQQ